MFKTILVAIDGSELAEEVMNTLIDLRVQVETKIILSHVINAIGDEAHLAVDRPQNYAEEIPYRHIEKQLEAYQAQLPCPSTLEIVSGDPAEEIIRLANIYHVDLIVMGSRGLTGLTRILQGSVSSQVVTDAPCSVLVVKPK